MLREEERALFEDFEGAIVASDATSCIAYMNGAAAALFRRDPAGLVGQPLTVLMPRRMHEAHRAGFRRYLATHRSRLLGRPVRVPALRGDGTQIEIELMLRMFRRPDGTDLIVASLRDVTAGPPAGRDVLELETRLQRRTYELI